jgi:hypothetical protein
MPQRGAHGGQARGVGPGRLAAETACGQLDRGDLVERARQPVPLEMRRHDGRVTPLAKIACEKFSGDPAGANRDHGAEFAGPTQSRQQLAPEGRIVLDELHDKEAVDGPPGEARLHVMDGGGDVRPAVGHHRDATDVRLVQDVGRHHFHDDVRPGQSRTIERHDLGAVAEVAVLRTRDAERVEEFQPLGLEEHVPAGRAGAIDDSANRLVIHAAASRPA